MDLIDGTHRSVEISCDGENGYDDSNFVLRLSSIFVIFIGSTGGALAPIALSRFKNSGIPSWIFASMKYFGSGVIIATAFIHLLTPATEALSSPCLSGPITEYNWAEGIVLISIFVMFFVELIMHRYDVFGPKSRDIESESVVSIQASQWDGRSKELQNPAVLHAEDSTQVTANQGSASNFNDCCDVTTARNSFTQVPSVSPDAAQPQIPSKTTEDFYTNRDNFSNQLTAMFILEFGVIFHSIFIGLTLAVTANDEFNILFTVLTFHQTFEGLGLGSRLSGIMWPEGKSWMPWLFGIAYGLTTPFAIGIGICIHKSFDPGSNKSMIVNGIFDAISAGILIYTGLVELMANEFIYNTEMRQASFKTVAWACFSMILGAGVMALLGKWA